MEKRWGMSWQQFWRGAPPFKQPNCKRRASPIHRKGTVANYQIANKHTKTLGEYHQDILAKYATSSLGTPVYLVVLNLPIQAAQWSDTRSAGIVARRGDPH